MDEVVNLSASDPVCEDNAVVDLEAEDCERVVGATTLVVCESGASYEETTPEKRSGAVRVSDSASNVSATSSATQLSDTTRSVCNCSCLERPTKKEVAALNRIQLAGTKRAAIFISQSLEAMASGNLLEDEEPVVVTAESTAEEHVREDIVQLLNEIGYSKDRVARSNWIDAKAAARWNEAEPSKQVRIPKGSRSSPSGSPDASRQQEVDQFARRSAFVTAYVRMLVERFENCLTVLKQKLRNDDSLKQLEEWDLEQLKEGTLDADNESLQALLLAAVCNRNMKDLEMKMKDTCSVLYRSVYVIALEVSKSLGMSTPRGPRKEAGQFTQRTLCFTGSQSQSSAIAVSQPVAIDDGVGAPIGYNKPTQ
jgi:hypothetical protein